MRLRPFTDADWEDYPEASGPAFINDENVTLDGDPAVLVVSYNTIYVFAGSSDPARQEAQVTYLRRTQHANSLVVAQALTERLTSKTLEAIGFEREG